MHSLNTGDGLALMRMNHVLAAKADVYFDQTPFTIPMQGKYPTCNMHARARARNKHQAQLAPHHTRSRLDMCDRR
jgi:hypothetical protein